MKMFAKYFIIDLNFLFGSKLTHEINFVRELLDSLVHTQIVSLLGNLKITSLSFQ